jgi:hypothetical protein
MPCLVFANKYIIHHLYIPNTANNFTASKVPAQAGTARFVLFFGFFTATNVNTISCLQYIPSCSWHSTHKPFLLALNITNDCKFLGVIR